MSRLERIGEYGKFILLKYDAGFVAGPHVLTEETVNPKTAFETALEGRYHGLAVYPGIAKNYHKHEYIEVPLFVILNTPTGKTLISSTEQVLQLHSSGVIIHANPYEEESLKNTARVTEEMHNANLPVIAMLSNTESIDVMAHHVRMMSELGVDIISIPPINDNKGFEWLVKVAGKSWIIINDTHPRTETTKLMDLAYKSINQGARGVAVGPGALINKPLQTAKALREIILRKRTPEEVKVLLT